MLTADEELQRKIEVLRKSFAAGLVGRMNELETALASLADGSPLSGQAMPIRSILEQSHKIAGSAGSFGYGTMSVIASEIEQLCDAILKNRHGSDVAAQVKLRERIAALHAEMPQ